MASADGDQADGMRRDDSNVRKKHVDSSEELRRNRSLIMKDTERLALILESRENQAKKRIKKDGFDEYAPLEKGGGPFLN